MISTASRCRLLATSFPLFAVLACTAPGPEADLIVENARIWTGDSTNPWAEAMAVRGERLLVVGARGEVRQHRTRHTRVIDAGGRLITPGFIDNHTHFNSAGALLLGVNLLDVSTAEPFAQRVREALRLVRAAQPARSFEQRLREARVAVAHLNELGVTGIHDITLRDQFPVYHALKEQGELTVRVYARPTLDKWDELTEVGIPHGFGDVWLKVGGLKGFVDGIQGNSTARFYEPQLHSGLRGSWRDSTNTAATSGSGSGMMPPGNMERNLAGADRAGLWPQVHAIGNEAIDTLLTLYEKVMRENPMRERRFRIIHSQVLRGAHVAERYAQLGVIAEVQPYHAIDDMRWMGERIGERSRWAYAFRTLHDAGVMLTFGSDWPGTNASWYTANPMQVIYAALTRQTLDGQPAGGWFPEERLDLETALRADTVNNAWAAGEEREKGRLMAGFLADFVILERDLFEITPEEIKDVRALLTVVGGGIVHDLGEIAGIGPDS